MNQINDLRSALELLRNLPGQLAETSIPVDPMAELAGVYRYVGAGGTVMRPTKEGPAMIFNNIKGYPGARIAIGLLASRDRVAALFGCEPRRSLPQRRRPASRWSIWRRTRISTCVPWSRPLPTPP